MMKKKTKKQGKREWLSKERREIKRIKGEEKTKKREKKRWRKRINIGSRKEKEQKKKQEKTERILIKGISINHPYKKRRIHYTLKSN